MREKLSKIRKSITVRNIGKLISANVIAQAIGLLVYPFLTRIYAPEDFGLMSLFLSIGGVFVILSTLEWNRAIVLPKQEEESRAVVHLALVVVSLSFVLLLFTIPFARPIAEVFDTPKLARYYWLMPFYVFLMGSWNVINYWYIRQKAYSRISGYQVSQSLFSAGYKVGFGLLGKLNGGLIFASVLSPLCALFISISLSAKTCIRPLLSLDWSACRRVAARYVNFPKYSLPHSLINYIAGQMPVLLLTPFFSSREVGFWSMAILLSFAPIGMVTNALSQVFYQQITEQVNEHRSIISFYRRFTTWTLAVVVPFFTVLWFFLPMLTQWLLGEEWRITGEYIRWLLPWLICVLLCASSGYLFDIFQKQKHGLYFEILIAIARLIGLGIGIFYNDFAMAIAGYAIASALINALQYIWMMHLVRQYEKEK